MKFEVEQSITKAIAGQSKLIPEILEMKGMSTPQNRHLLNNILNTEGINYLEIGVWHGSTFISALYGNKVNAYAIDNWSEFNDNESRHNFHVNCDRFGISGFTLFEDDSFKVNLEHIRDKINVFFYDGDHNYEQTRKALSYFLPVLDDEFLFIADDYTWEGVKEGVCDGIRDCKLSYIMGVALTDKIWWNGLGIFILSKNNKL